MYLFSFGGKLLTNEKSPPLFFRSIFNPTHHSLPFLVLFLAVGTDLVGKRCGGNLGSQISPTAFSNQIRSDSKKENKKRKRMMGWIENGPQKKGRRFFVRQQLPTKTEKVCFKFISLILYQSFGDKNEP
jgi:hypothetical protein